MNTSIDQLPATGFIRLNKIIGNPKKGIEPIFPISRSTWYEGVKTGKYPRGKRIGKRTTVYAVSDIRQLLEDIAKGEVQS